MTPKKIKPVKAWAVRAHDGSAWLWALHTRRREAVVEVREWADHGYSAEVVRVEIRPVAQKRKRKAKK